MYRLKRLLIAALLMVAVAGCVGGSDKGKNKDKDVPKTADAPGK